MFYSALKIKQTFWPVIVFSSNWSCSKCGEEVSKEKVDQVGGQQSLIAKILSNIITDNSIKCSHQWAEIGVVSSR